MEKFKPATKTLFSCQPYKNLLSFSEIFFALFVATNLQIAPKM